MHYSEYYADTPVVICVASGASAFDVPKWWFHSYAVIAINRSYELIPREHPNAALYAADAGFWAHYKNARRFHGAKFASAKQVKSLANDAVIFQVRRRREGLDVDKFVKDPANPLKIGHGSHSGFQAVNIAVNFGAKLIGLVGYDYCGDHWHEDHPRALRNPARRCACLFGRNA